MKVVGVQIPPPAPRPGWCDPNRCRHLLGQSPHCLVSGLTCPDVGNRCWGQTTLPAAPPPIYCRIDIERSSQHGPAYASHRNHHRRPQAGVPRRRSGERSLGPCQRPPDPDEGPGQNQRLPAWEGAGRPSQEGLWARGDGGDHRPDGARDQRQDRDRSRVQAGDGPQGHDDRGQGRDRERDRRQDRPRLHGGAGSGAPDRPCRLQVDQAGQAHHRGDRRGHQRRPPEDRRAEPALRGKARGKHGRERRPRDRSPSPEPSTACRSKAAPARTFP